MQGYNLIAVFSQTEDKLLMCKREKNPYKGLANLVGGKIEKNENGMEAAYRELQEETTITRNDIILYHLMDFTYYGEDCFIEVYFGKLNKEIKVSGDENELFWSDLEQNFSDETKYAGNGNIDHIMKVIKLKNEERQ